MPVLNVKPQYINGGDHQPPIRRKVELTDHYQTWLQNYNEIRHEVNSATAYAVPKTIVYRNGNGDFGANRIFMNEMILGSSDPYGDTETNSTFKIAPTEFSLGPSVTMTVSGPANLNGETNIRGPLTVSGSSFDVSSDAGFYGVASFDNLVKLSSSSTFETDGPAIFNNTVDINDDLSLDGNFYLNGDSFQTGNSIIDGNLDLSEDLVVRGNLTVLGLRTQLEVSELVVEDKNILINKNDLYTPLDSGIFIQKGVDVRSGYFKVHASDDSLLQFKAPTSFVTTIANPNKDVTVTFYDDFEANQKLLTTSNVMFRSVTVDGTYPRHADVPSYTQDNDIIGKDKGWVSTPWVYTNAIESYSDLETSNTTGIFMGTSTFSRRDELSLVTKGNESLYISKEGDIGLGTNAPLTDLHISKNSPVLQISTTNYTQTSELRLTDLTNDITDSGLYLSYNANTSEGRLELTTDSLNSILNLSVGGFDKTSEVSIQNDLVIVHTDLDVIGNQYITNELVVDNTLYVRSNKVGINVNNPNEALNVSGNIQGDSNLLLDGVEPFILLGNITALEPIGRSGLVIEEESPIVQLSTTDPSYRHGSVVYFNDSLKDRHWSLGTVNDGQSIDIGKSFGSGVNTPEYGLDEYHGETLLRLNSADKAEWYLESSSSSPAMMLNTRNTGIQLYLGEKDSVQTPERSTTAYLADQFSSVIQWHGSLSTTGELSYFPNGNDDGEYGSFRFSRTNGTVNQSHPSAKVGVEQLYAHDKIAVSQLTPTAELHITKDVTKILQETESGDQYFTVDVDTSNIFLHGNNAPGLSSFTLSAMNPAMSQVKSDDYNGTIYVDHITQVATFNLLGAGSGFSLSNDNANDFTEFYVTRGDKLYHMKLDGANDVSFQKLENSANAYNHTVVTDVKFNSNTRIEDQHVTLEVDNINEYIHEQYTNRHYSSQLLELNSTDIQFEQTLLPNTYNKVSLNPTNTLNEVQYKPNYYSNTSINDDFISTENRANDHFFSVISNRTNRASRLELNNVDEEFLVDIDHIDQKSIRRLTTVDRTEYLNLDDKFRVAQYFLDAPDGYHFHVDLNNSGNYSFQEFSTTDSIYRVQMDDIANTSYIHLYNDYYDAANSFYKLNIDDNNQYVNQHLRARERFYQLYIDEANEKSWIELDNANNYNFDVILDDPIDRGYLNLNTNQRNFTTELDGVLNKSYIDMNNTNNYKYHVNLDGTTANAFMLLSTSGKSYKVEMNHPLDKSFIHLDHDSDYYYHLDLDRSANTSEVNITTLDRYYRMYMNDLETHSFLELNNDNNYFYQVDLDDRDDTSFQKLLANTRYFDVELNGNLDRSYMKLDNDSDYYYYTYLDTNNLKTYSKLFANNRNYQIELNNADESSFLQLDSTSNYYHGVFLDNASMFSNTVLLADDKSYNLKLDYVRDRSTLSVDNANNYVYNLDLDHLMEISHQEMKADTKTYEVKLSEANDRSRMAMDNDNNYFYEVDLHRESTLIASEKMFADTRYYQKKLDNTALNSDIKLYDSGQYIFNTHLDTASEFSKIDLQGGYGRNYYTLLDTSNQKSEIHLTSLSHIPGAEFSYQVLLDDGGAVATETLAIPYNSFKTTLDNNLNDAELLLDNTQIDGLPQQFKVYINTPSELSTLLLNHEADYKYSVDIDKNNGMTLSQLQNGLGAYWSVDVYGNPTIATHGPKTRNRMVTPGGRTYELDLTDNAKASHLFINNNDNYYYQLMLDKGNTQTASYQLKADTTRLEVTVNDTEGNTYVGFDNTSYTLQHIDPTNQCIYQAYRNSITVCVDANFSSDVHIDGGLDVDGPTTLNSTLDVDGATTLNSTLDVDGATTLNSTLDVDGDTTLHSDLHVDGNTSIDGGLDVDGPTTLNSTLHVDGDITTESNIFCRGNTYVDGDILVGPGSTTGATPTPGNPTAPVTNVYNITNNYNNVNYNDNIDITYGPDTEIFNQGDIYNSSTSTTTYDNGSVINNNGTTNYGPTSDINYQGDSTYLTNSTTTFDSGSTFISNTDDFCLYKLKWYTGATCDPNVLMEDGIWKAPVWLNAPADGPSIVASDGTTNVLYEDAGQQHSPKVVLDNVKLGPNVIGAPPVGSIIAWHNGDASRLAKLESGWVLCNGSNGTPDLTDKIFLRGYTATATTIKGQEEVVLVTDNLPIHTHTIVSQSVATSPGLAGSTPLVGGQLVSGTTTRMYITGTDNPSHNHLNFKSSGNTPTSYGLTASQFVTEGGSRGASQYYLNRTTSVPDVGLGGYPSNSHTHNSDHQHDMNHTHNMTLSDVGANLAFDNQPKYLDIQWIMRIY